MLDLRSKGRWFETGLSKVLLILHILFPSFEPVHVMALIALRNDSFSSHSCLNLSTFMLIGGSNMGDREFGPLWKIQGWENSGIYEVTPYHVAFTGIFRNYLTCSGIFWLF